MLPGAAAPAVTPLPSWCESTHADLVTMLRPVVDGAVWAAGGGGGRGKRGAADRMILLAGAKGSGRSSILRRVREDFDRAFEYQAKVVLIDMAEIICLKYVEGRRNLLFFWMCLATCA